MSGERPHDPWYPVEGYFGQVGQHGAASPGVSVRMQLAAMAMQALVGRPNLDLSREGVTDVIVDRSFRIADMMLDRSAR